MTSNQYDKLHFKDLDEERNFMIMRAMCTDCWEWQEETGQQLYDLGQAIIKPAGLRSKAIVALDDEAKQALLSFMQRAFVWNGNDRQVWEAFGIWNRRFRELFLVCCRMPIPKRWRRQREYDEWIADYAPQLDAWEPRIKARAEEIAQLKRALRSRSKRDG